MNPVIELLEYNYLLSLFDFFETNFSNKIVHGKKMSIVQSYSDISEEYETPALTLEILHRKNRALSFNNYLYNIEDDNGISEIEGNLLEYRVQLNVYSNTRGENHKWSSILDMALKKGEKGIPLNTYLDNGNLKSENLGIITYDYSTDVKNNNMMPNIVTYDFHTIYEVKMGVIQEFKMDYNYMEIGNIISKLKRGDNNGSI